MPQRPLAVTVALLGGFLAVYAASAHDMFLKLGSFFLPPNSDVTISLINGTFQQSENSISRDRMVDVSVVGPDDEIDHPPESNWRDENNAALLSYRTGAPGTYTIGVSTRPNNIELAAADFNEYLQHDGVVDTLKSRTDAGELELDARERYSKHVKAIVQVGSQRSSAFTASLGYPVEFIPLQNPYQLRVGDTFEVKFLRDGQPVGNQMVYASHEAFHGHDESGGHVEAFSGRTNEAGVISLPLSASGRWYVRTIHMLKVDEDEVDYESNWATLTFEIATAENQLNRQANQSTEPQQMQQQRTIPWTLIAIIILLIVGLALFWLRRLG